MAAGAFAPPEGRGGRQRIPRPAGARLGAEAPWAHLPASERRVDLDRVRAALDGAGPARRSPREHLVSRGAAVLAALHDPGDGARVLLTRRSEAMRVHNGEVSFPGGRQEPGESLLGAALRETYEEIGLPAGAVEVIGELDHLSTVTSDSFIVPYVGVLERVPELRRNPVEVDAVLDVPLSELLDPANFREERWSFDHLEIDLVFFELVGDTVWGATAAMLRQLLGLATGTVGRGELGHS